MAIKIAPTPGLPREPVANALNKQKTQKARSLTYTPAHNPLKGLLGDGSAVGVLHRVSCQKHIQSCAALEGLLSGQGYADHHAWTGRYPERGRHSGVNGLKVCSCLNDIG